MPESTETKKLVVIAGRGKCAADSSGVAPALLKTTAIRCAALNGEYNAATGVCKVDVCGPAVEECVAPASHVPAVLLEGDVCPTGVAGAVADGVCVVDGGACFVERPVEHNIVGAEGCAAHGLSPAEPPIIVLLTDEASCAADGGSYQEGQCVFNKCSDSGACSGDDSLRATLKVKSEKLCGNKADANGECELANVCLRKPPAVTEEAPAEENTLGGTISFIGIGVAVLVVLIIVLLIARMGSSANASELAAQLSRERADRAAAREKATAAFSALL